MLKEVLVVLAGTEVEAVAVEVPAGVERSVGSDALRRHVRDGLI